MTAVLLVVTDLSDNSLGRAYCLWLLARDRGHDCVVVAPSGPREIWLPLRDTAFADAVRGEVLGSADDVVASIESSPPDVVLAVKPMPSSLVPAAKIARLLGVPLVVDIDDPDLDEILAVRSPLKRLAKNLLRAGEMRNARACRRIALDAAARITSNPELQMRWGGTLIPHVRPDSDLGDVEPSPPPDEDSELRIAFIGTNRRHKGVPLLRSAVAGLQQGGQAVSLTVTDAAPADAEPWEHWVGMTSLEQGRTLLRQAEIVVLPSLKEGWSSSQLPVKLIDALMAEKPLIVSDFAPLRWAAGEAGLVIRPGRRDDLMTAILELAEPAVRTRLARAASARARDLFTVSAQAESFAAVIDAALNRPRDDPRRANGTAAGAQRSLKGRL